MPLWTFQFRFDIEVGVLRESVAAIAMNSLQADERTSRHELELFGWSAAFPSSYWTEAWRQFEKEGFAESLSLGRFSFVLALWTMETDGRTEDGIVYIAGYSSLRPPLLEQVQHTWLPRFMLRERCNNNGSVWRRLRSAAHSDTSCGQTFGHATNAHISIRATFRVSSLFHVIW